MKKRLWAALAITVMMATSVCGAEAVTEGPEVNGGPATLEKIMDQESGAEAESEAEEAGHADAEAQTGGDGIAEKQDGRAILGSDDRWQIYNTSQYPYSAICYIEAHARCGDTWTGSGFMVGKRVVLTAAHCLCCTDHGETVDELDLYFGYQTNGSCYYHYGGATRYTVGTTFPGGYTNSNIGYDYGVIQLDENVGDYTGWFGTHIPSNDELDYGVYQVAGYRQGVMMANYGITELDTDSRLFLTNADTLPGNSGCPIFDDNNYVVGINVAESTDGFPNTGVRLNREIFNLMDEYE